MKNLFNYFTQRARRSFYHLMWVRRRHDIAVGAYFMLLALLGLALLYLLTGVVLYLFF